jgi:glycosyltransferase involved in cell wall biosynthesis
MDSRAIRVGFNGSILANPEIRGLTRYTTQLLCALSRRSDVSIFLFSPTEMHPPHLEGVRATPVVFDAPRETLWMDWVLPRKIREFGIDVFHAPAERGIPFLKPCPLVLTIHNSYERAHWREVYPRLKGKLWYWKFEAVNYTRANVIITVSDTTRKELIQWKVAREHQLRRVYLAPAPEFHPNSAALDAAHNAEFDAGVIRKYDMKCPYILYVGGYNVWKNTDALVQAFDLANLPNHTLVIAARKQWDYEALRKRWSSLRSFTRMRLIEALPEELPSLYRRADFFVNPSVWESFSFQVTEAMASGTPLLCSNRTAMPEIAGEAAQYFDPGNQDELVYWLRRFTTDIALKSQLRDQGLERVKMFSWDATAEQTVAIYRSLVDHESKQKERH